jgi:hypothetical protein
MAGHQIVRVTKGMRQGHAHIERVWLADGSELTTSEVVNLMLNGHSYFTISRSTGALTPVLPYKCENCDHWGIRARSENRKATTSTT